MIIVKKYYFKGYKSLYTSFNCNILSSITVMLSTIIQHNTHLQTKNQQSQQTLVQTDVQFSPLNHLPQGYICAPFTNVTTNIEPKFFNLPRCSICKAFPDKFTIFSDQQYSCQVCGNQQQCNGKQANQLKYYINLNKNDSARYLISKTTSNNQLQLIFVVDCTLKQSVYIINDMLNQQMGNLLQLANINKDTVIQFILFTDRLYLPVFRMVQQQLQLNIEILNETTFEMPEYFVVTQKLIDVYQQYQLLFQNLTLYDNYNQFFNFKCNKKSKTSKSNQLVSKRKKRITFSALEFAIKLLQTNKNNKFQQICLISFGPCNCGINNINQYNRNNINAQLFKSTENQKDQIKQMFNLLISESYNSLYSQLSKCEFQNITINLFIQLDQFVDLAQYTKIIKQTNGQSYCYNHQNYNQIYSDLKQYIQNIGNKAFDVIIKVINNCSITKCFGDVRILCGGVHQICDSQYLSSLDPNKFCFGVVFQNINEYIERKTIKLIEFLQKNPEQYVQMQVFYTDIHNCQQVIVISKKIEFCQKLFHYKLYTYQSFNDYCNSVNINQKLALLYFYIVNNCFPDMQYKVKTNRKDKKEYVSTIFKNGLNLILPQLQQQFQQVFKHIILKNNDYKQLSNQSIQFVRSVYYLLYQSSFSINQLNYNFDTFLINILLSTNCSIQQIQQHFTYRTVFVCPKENNKEFVKSSCGLQQLNKCSMLAQKYNLTRDSLAIVVIFELKTILILSIQNINELMNDIQTTNQDIQQTNEACQKSQQVRRICSVCENCTEEYVQNNGYFECDKLEEEIKDYNISKLKNKYKKEASEYSTSDSLEKTICSMDECTMTMLSNQDELYMNMSNNEIEYSQEVNKIINAFSNVQKCINFIKSEYQLEFPQINLVCKNNSSQLKQYMYEDDQIIGIQSYINKLLK